MLNLQTVGDLPAVARADTARVDEVSHPYFKRRLEGSLLSARVAWGRSAPVPKPQSAAAKRGLSYERKVLKTLEGNFPRRFIAQLPFTFRTQAKTGWAIPDGLLFDFDRRLVLLLEIKYTHGADAWWQLHKFYLPIVQEALPSHRIIPVEICRTYDPAVRLPKAPLLLTGLEEAFEAREGALAILATRTGDCGGPQDQSHAEFCPYPSGD